MLRPSHHARNPPALPAQPALGHGWLLLACIAIVGCESAPGSEPVGLSQHARERLEQPELLGAEPLPAEPTPTTAEAPAAVAAVDAAPVAAAPSANAPPPAEPAAVEPPPAAAIPPAGTTAPTPGTAAVAEPEAAAQGADAVPADAAAADNAAADNAAAEKAAADKAAAEKAAADKAAAAKAAAERAAARAASRREAEPQVERKSESAAKPAKAELASSGDAKLDKATAGVDPSLDATDLYYLGKRQLESGQRDAAIISLTASLQRRPSDRTRALLGRALFDAGRMSEAEKVLKRAPRHADALLLLATLYQHRGRVSDARRTYQAFLTHHADHQKAAWVRDLLRTL